MRKRTWNEVKVKKCVSDCSCDFSASLDSALRPSLFFLFFPVKDTEDTESHLLMALPLMCSMIEILQISHKIYKTKQLRCWSWDYVDKSLMDVLSFSIRIELLSHIMIRVGADFFCRDDQSSASEGVN